MQNKIAPEKPTLEKINHRIIREFLDIIVLEQLRENTASSYDIIIYLNSRFQTVVSPGTIYALMYSMERDGLIQGVWAERKRQYKITEEGQRLLKELDKAESPTKELLKILTAKQVD